jgi:hypothetical protein
MFVGRVPPVRQAHACRDMAAGSESHQFDRTTARAADAMRVGLRRTAHGEGDPQALHELPEAAETADVEVPGKNSVTQTSFRKLKTPGPTGLKSPVWRRDAGDREDLEACRHYQRYRRRHTCNSLKTMGKPCGKLPFFAHLKQPANSFGCMALVAPRKQVFRTPTVRK